MEENKLKEILYAYSAGCLDKEDYPQLAGLLNSGNKMFARELADMQNIITLIPGILEIEQPNPRVKDKVARKLLRIKGEAKAETKPLEVSPEKETVAVNENSSKNEDTLKEENKEDNNDGYKNMPYVPLSEQVSAASENESTQAAETPYRDLPNNNSSNIPDKPAYINKNEINEGFERLEHKVEHKEKKSHALAYFILGLLLSILLSGGVYYLISKELVKNKAQISALDGQISALTSELAKLKQNQKVLALLQARDTKVYSLDGTDSNTKGFGKLTVSAEGKEGILQLYNMPSLSGNQVYQLWAANKEQAVSLGAFRTSRDAEYFPIEQLPFDQNQIVSFIVTLEENGSAAAPSKNIYLSGLVKKI